MPWIESHAGLVDHPKTVKAAHLLGIEPVQLVGHLHVLWHWALTYAEFGDLSRFDAADIALAAKWPGAPDEFAQALIECGPGDSAGFLERDGVYGPPDDPRVGDLVLHDWWDCAGKLVDRRWRDAQRKRDARARSNGHPDPDPSTSNGRHDPEPSPSAGRPQDVPETPARTADEHPDTDPRARTNTTNTTNTTNPPTGHDDDADASPSPFSTSEQSEELAAEADGQAATAPEQPDPIDQQFASFWDRYPRHHTSGKPGGGGSRKRALQRWRNLTQRQRDQALAAVDNYRVWCERDDGEFAAHVTRWLNEERWEQWQQPAPPPSSSNGATPRAGPRSAGHEPNLSDEPVTAKRVQP
jgi:hypothetical protein